MIITTTPFWTGRIAKKTKGLKAKPMINLLVDRSVASKFLVDTLEGKEPITEAAMFCIGEAGDAWQQEAKRVLKKYDVASIDADGWLICTPKPENSVEFFEVTAEFFGEHVNERCYIVGLFGETLGDVKNCQLVKLGDYIARQRDDHADQWVVARKIWLNSYSEMSV